MAERRMFAKTIIDSDAFLDMPMSARLLYYDLAMRADDDGFINSPKKIMRFVGASIDDLNILAIRKFIIPFDNGVVVIKHWRIHNYIRKDTYKETAYTSEKSLLEEDRNHAYRLINSDKTALCQPSVNEPSTNRQRTVDAGKDRIGKDRLGKDKEISPTRHKYGEYQNVLLSDEDLEKLKKEFLDWSDRIEHLSAYMASTGKSYKNHLATIRNWARRDSKTPTADVKPTGRASYDLTEFERAAAQKPIVYKRKNND